MAYSKSCEETVLLMVRKDGTDVIAECGHWWGGTQQFCSPCEKQIAKEYPQGYRGYPGDICKHGTYVGGSGRDLMCGLCEMGED